jgi:hypothetical protein
MSIWKLLYFKITLIKTKKSFYKSKTKGRGQNKFGVGSVVELVFWRGNHQTGINPFRGFQSSIDYVMTFGIGTKKLIPYK